MAAFTAVVAPVAPVRPVSVHAQARPSNARPLIARPALVASNKRFLRFVAHADAGEVFPKVQKVVSEQLGVDISKVTPDAKFVDLGADSLDTVEIMMAFEETFKLDLDEDGADKIVTVQQAAELIAEQINLAVPKE